MQNRELHKMWMKEQCPVIKCSNLNTLFREKYMDTWVSLEKKKKCPYQRPFTFFIIYSEAFYWLHCELNRTCNEMTYKFKYP